MFTQNISIHIDIGYGWFGSFNLSHEPNSAVPLLISTFQLGPREGRSFFSLQESQKPRNFAVGGITITCLYMQTETTALFV